MLKNLKNKSASILLLVVVISSSAMILFLTVSFMWNQYLKQISSLEYWNLADNYVESWIEEWIVRYFENSEKKYSEYENCLINNTDSDFWNCENKRRKEVLYWKILENKNQESWKIISEKILIKHKWIIWESETQIWELKVNASRLVDKIEWKLYPFEKFEFRLTAEEREKSKQFWKNWEQSEIKKLKIVWNKLNWDTNNAQIKILQIRWPIWQKWNVQTHKIHLEHWWIYTFWDFWDETSPENSSLKLPTNDIYTNPTNDTDFEKFEYIYILESSVSPIVFEIYWFTENWEKIKLPDRNVYFEARSNIWWYNFDLWWENSWRSFNKTLKVKKEIYTNFDSNFDYARNFINF